jgi:hypothetical protein
MFSIKTDRDSAFWNGYGHGHGHGHGHTKEKEDFLQFRDFEMYLSILSRLCKILPHLCFLILLGI